MSPIATPSGIIRHAINAQSGQRAQRANLKRHMDENASRYETEGCGIVSFSPFLSLHSMFWGET
ncbi:hypothetical protein [Prevotella sp. S7-1-8]|uniref:hypothetical protein n=1 Tax=Prevotella sp. S7-1-8 TaxID=1284775 RepID=UPI000AB57CBD|nr:hypothetical protein [Prevotella sp. S7-1-8]